MFDKLTNTIQAQVDSGIFEPVASVHYAEATMTDGTDGDTSYDTQGNAAPGGIIGATVAAVVVLGAVIAGYVYMKKKNGDDGCGSSAAVAPTNRGPGEVVQVLSGDFEVIDAGPAIRGHVFG